MSGKKSRNGRNNVSRFDRLTSAETLVKETSVLPTQEEKEETADVENLDADPVQNDAAADDDLLSYDEFGGEAIADSDEDAGYLSADEDADDKQENENRGDGETYDVEDMDSEENDNYDVEDDGNDAGENTTSDDEQEFVQDEDPLAENAETATDDNQAPSFSDDREQIVEEDHENAENDVYGAENEDEVTNDPAGDNKTEQPDSKEGSVYEKRTYDFDRDSQTDEEYIASLESKLGVCLGKMKELTSVAQRVQADFDNYRRRNATLAQDMKELGQSAVIEKLLGVLDNCDLARKYISDPSALTGFNMMESQILTALEGFGLSEVEADGKTFDAKTMNAVERVKDVQNAGKVVEVMQKGYTLKGKLLRPASVKIGYGD